MKKTRLKNFYILKNEKMTEITYKEYLLAEEAGTNDYGLAVQEELDENQVLILKAIINPENDQRLAYFYIPKEEEADYELEIQNKRSTIYTDYQNTLADKYIEAFKAYIAARDDFESLSYWNRSALEYRILMSAIKKLTEIKQEIYDLQSKCSWNSWVNPEE